MPLADAWTGSCSSTPHPDSKRCSINFLPGALPTKLTLHPSPGNCAWNVHTERSAKFPEGRIHYLERYSMNTDYQAQLEEIVSMLQEDSSIGLDLNHKADQYRREKNWEKAEEYADRSIQLCQDIKDKHAAGFGLLRKGIIYHAQGRLQDAIRLYQASLEAFVNDRHNKAVVYFALGIAYHELSNWRETLKNYRVSMRISHGLDDLLYSMVEKRWRQAVELSGGGVKGVGEEVEVVEEKDKE